MERDKHGHFHGKKSFSVAKAFFMEPEDGPEGDSRREAKTMDVTRVFVSAWWGKIVFSFLPIGFLLGNFEKS